MSVQAGSVDRPLLTSIIYLLVFWVFELHLKLPRKNQGGSQQRVHERVVRRRRHACTLGSFRDRWRPSDVQTLRHMFLISRDSNNIMVEEFRFISCYQRAPLFIVVSLGGLMGLKPLGAPDLKSNYAHSGEWLRQMECLLLFCLCSLQADQMFELKRGPSPNASHSKLLPLLNAVLSCKPWKVSLIVSLAAHWATGNYSALHPSERTGLAEVCRQHFRRRLSLFLNNSRQ